MSTLVKHFCQVTTLHCQFGRMFRRLWRLLELEDPTHDSVPLSYMARARGVSIGLTSRQAGIAASNQLVFFLQD